MLNLVQEQQNIRRNKMKTKAPSDRALKLKATLREHKRVYDDMILPARNIVAQCSDGIWIKKAWTSPHSFGWSKWEKQ